MRDIVNTHMQLVGDQLRPSYVPTKTVLLKPDHLIATSTFFFSGNKLEGSAAAENVSTKQGMHILLLMALEFNI